MRLKSARIKIHQILISFETTNQFFFKFCMNLQCHETQLLCIFLAEILYAFNKRSLSRYKFTEIKSQKFGTLMVSFWHFWSPFNIKFQLKNTEELSLLTLKSDAKLKKNWLAVSNIIWGILWIFTQPLKSPKVSLWWSIFVWSIHEVCVKYTWGLCKVYMRFV